MLSYIEIILSAIFFSSEFSKRKITNFKPLSCEVCLAFWLTICLQLFRNDILDYILMGGMMAQITRITFVLLTKFYSNVITK